MTDHHHEAERLDNYVQAVQHNALTDDEFPFVDELLTLANSLEATPTIKEKVHTMDTSKGQSNRSLMRWASAAAVVLLVLTIFILDPGLQNLASAFFTIFEPRTGNIGSSLEPTVTPPADFDLAEEDTASFNASGPLTLDEVLADADASPDITFEVSVPTVLPVDFTYNNGEVDEYKRVVTLFYVSSDYLSTLLIQMFDRANSNPSIMIEFPVGDEATVEEVLIGDVTGEYVEGNYTLEGIWDATSQTQRLAWEKDNVLYIITVFYEEKATLSLSDLLAVAEGLNK